MSQTVCLECKSTNKYHSKKCSNFGGEEKTESEQYKPVGTLKIDVEYEAIVKSGEFGSMTIEDMKWIDQNI